MAQLRSVFTVATDLAQTRSPRLRRGIRRGAIEALFGAVPYVCLYLVLVDLLAGEVSFTRTLVLLLVMFGALAIQIAIGVGAMIDVMIASYSLFGAARLRIADHIRRLPMGWFTQQRSGALLGVMTRELTLLADIWSHFMAFLSGGVAIPVVIGGFLMFVDWRLGLVMMVTLPLAFALLAAAMRMLARVSDQMLAATADANQAVTEYCEGIAVLRTFGRFGQGYARLEHSLSQLRRTSLRTEVVPAPLTGTFGFTVEAGFSLLVLTGAWLLIDGGLSAEVFLLFVVVSVKFYSPIYDLGVSLLLLRFARQALERTQTVIDTPVLPDVAVSRATPASAELRFDAVDFSYEGETRQALAEVSLTIPERSLTAIVGPSGSGKSTLVHLMARLWDVDSGRITLGGVDLRDLNSYDLNRRIAMVFQDVVLFSGSIRDNIAIGDPEASDEAIVDAARRAQAHDFVTALPDGYDTKIGQGGVALSGGERQRISIARALLADADIVLLDEATASVDPATEAAFQRAVDELVRGKTVVVIAHRLRTVRRAAQIIVLDEGRIRERGTHDELVAANDLYARLWRLQSEPGATAGHR